MIASSSFRTSIGLVRCMEKPADSLRRTSSSEPKPLIAIPGKSAGFTHQFQSRAVGQLDVADHQVEFRPRRAAALAAARLVRRSDLVSALTENQGQVAERIRIVLDEQDPQAAGIGRGADEGRETGGAGTLAGTVENSRRNVAPLPRPGLLAVSRPPSDSTIPRLIARPRPRPPYRLRNVPSPCSNGSKIRAIDFGLDPDPRVPELDDQTMAAAEERSTGPSFRVGSPACRRRV